MPPKLQIPFCDSSDEDYHHTAPLDVIQDFDDSDEDRQKKRRKESASRRAIRDRDEVEVRDGDVDSGSNKDYYDGASNGSGSDDRTRERAEQTDDTHTGGWVDTLKSGVKRIMGTGNLVETEPFPNAIEGGRTDEFSETENFYGFHDSNVSTLSSDSVVSSLLSHEEDEYDDDIQIDLRETLLQYQRTPADFYLNIILATLKSITTMIDGYCFSAASGNPFLIKTLIDSGRVDGDDPQVQQIIQGEIDMVLQGHPSDGYCVWGDQCDYLRCLCQFKSARVSRDQMLLMFYSGFDFIKIIHDYPHLTSNQPPVPRAFVFVVKVFLSILIICGWLSIFVNLLFMASLIWITVYWFSYPAKVNNGWWTIICYVFGYVIQIVATMVAEGKTGRQYEDQVWRYPSSNLKIIPVFPVFESCLVAVVLRYAVMKDPKRYFIIRRDLWCSLSVQQIFHGLFYAFPQVTLQFFLYTTRKSKGTSIPNTTVCFWLLLGAGAASCFMSILATTRLVLFPHSCNAFGFAIKNVNPDSHKKGRLCNIKPPEMCVRLIYIHLLGYFITVTIVLFIHLLNISKECKPNVQAMLATYFGIIVVCIIIYFVFINYLPRRCVSAVCYLSLVPIIMQISYFIFARKQPMSDCTFIKYRYSGWTVPNLVAFGLLCVHLICWVVLSIRASFTAQTREHLVDQLACYFLQ